MAADVETASLNPCCGLWMKRCEKLEKSRDALRQSVKILEGQIERQNVQIVSLKNEVEQQQIQAKHHKDEWMKEVNIRKELEEEIQSMKFELSSIQKTANEKDLDANDSALLKARISEGEVEINRLKELLKKEKLKIDSEKRKAVSEKKKASEALKQLQEEKKRVEEQRGLLESERKKSEEFRICLEKLKIEANGVREKLNAESSKVHDAKKQIEVEKLKADKEKKRADSEKKKVEEQKKLIEEERKRAIDVKLNADILAQKLEEERRKRQEVQKKMEEISASKEGRTSFSEEREQKASKTLKIAELKLLKEQLKLERKRVKHAERVAKQEKSEKKFVMQEVRLLKQNLVQILCQLNILDDFISHRLGSADAKLKTLNSSDWSDLKLNSILLSKKGDFSSETAFGPSQIPLTYADPEGACIGLPVPKGCCSRTKTGIVSELGSPVGGFLRNKSQSSAVCSTSMHFTDRKLMGSQGRDSLFEVSADKLAEQANLNLAVPECPGETVHVGRHKSYVNSMCYDGSSKPIDKAKPWTHLSPNEDIYLIDGHIPKKRKIQNVTKLDMLHSKVHDKLSVLNDQVSCADHSASINRSHCYSGFENIYDEKLCQKDVQSNLCKHNYDCIMIESSSDCQAGKMLVKHDGKNAIVGHVKKNKIGSCCIKEDEPDSYHCQDVEAAFLGNQKANLADIEGIISEGCLKLLELDSDVEEERYRKAVEMPLSPTLPEIKMPAFQIDGDDSLNALEKNDIPLSHCFFDVMHVEISSNNSKLKIPVSNDLSGSRITPHVNLQDIAPLDILHITTNDNCRPCEGGSLIGESSHPCRKLNKEPERVPLLMEKGSVQLSVGHFSSEPNKAELQVLPISKGCNNNTISLRCETAQASFNLACGVSRCSSSQIFHEDCHTLDDLSLSGNLSSDVNCMTEILGDFQPINSVFCESQIEVSTVHDPVVAQSLSQILAPEAEGLIKGLRPISIQEKMEHNFQQSLVSVPNLGSPERTSPNERMKSLSKDNHASDSERNLCLFASLLSMRKKKNITRILHSLSTVTPQNFMVSKIDLLLVEVLNGLELEQGLLSEEKVAIIYSILLGNLSARLSDHCKYIVYENSFHLLDSFTVEIVRAVSALMAKCVWDQMFELDDLLCLIESFLIDREVLVIGDVEHHPSSIPTSPKKFHIDVGNKCLLSNDVTICQFVAGCTILASICVAADDIGFILVLSYKILRTDRDGFSWVLLALHVFASICGKKMFNQDSYGFLLITIKSVVAFLERGFKASSASLHCCLDSTSKMVMGFPPCKHCPFATGAMGMDELTGFLLEVLQGYIVLGSDYKTSNNCMISLQRILPISAMGDTDANNKSKCMVHCDCSCTIFMYQKLCGLQSDCSSDVAFCEFTDIVSLVELVGHYMNWEWTYKEAIPCLLKMLEGCVFEEFLAALFVLVGELGRIGVDSGGYQQPGISELRSNLTKLLGELTAKKRSLPTQLAAVGALLNLLPSSFEDILSNRQDASLASCESADAKHVREWFLQLNSEQQTASKNFFEVEDCLER